MSDGRWVPLRARGPVGVPPDSVVSKACSEGSIGGPPLAKNGSGGGCARQHDVVGPECGPKKRPENGHQHEVHPLWVYLVLVPIFRPVSGPTFRATNQPSSCPPERSSSFPLPWLRMALARSARLPPSSSLPQVHHPGSPACPQATLHCASPAAGSTGVHGVDSGIAANHRPARTPHRSVLSWSMEGSGAQESCRTKVALRNARLRVKVKHSMHFKRCGGSAVGDPLLSLAPAEARTVHPVPRHASQRISASHAAAASLA